MAVKFDFEESELHDAIEKYGDKLMAGLMMYADTKAISLESIMKRNRSWVDRTGTAKATLNAKATQVDDNVARITLSHGVEYGIWLEMAHEKKYAIIKPTLDSESPKVMDGLASIMEKL